MKKIAIFFIFCCLTSILSAVDYNLWDELLKEYTAPLNINGIEAVCVDYPGLKKDDRYAKLLDSFERTNLSELKTPEEKLAFWLNVYNFFTLNIIVANYPLSSIKDLDDIFNPLNQKPIATFGSRSYSLDEIKLILRQQFTEPLIHTALCSASLSGADIRAEAYKPENLPEQLQDQCVKYLANKTKGFSLNREEKVLYLSSIFTWDAEDFKKWGGIINFVEKYIPVEEKEFLNNNRCKIKYFAYSWELNLWEAKEKKAKWQK